MKDPAFLFYSGDFLNGVIDMTMEERGQYITLLCFQHQKGHIQKKTIRFLVGSCSVSVLSHFQVDENGCYFNKRLDEEIEKRRLFTESRRENGLKGGRPKGSTKKPSAKPSGYAKNNLMGNENINDNINKNININNNNINIYSYIENLYKRQLTSSEFNKIDNLLKEYKEELVRLAIDKSIENGVYKLKYTEAILKNWKNKNLDTISKIKDDELLLGVSKNDFYQEDVDYDWLNE